MNVYSLFLACLALTVCQTSAATIFRVGNASKAYPNLRAGDYNMPDGNNFVRADPNKGASAFSNRPNAPGGCKRNCWSIDSSKFFNNLKAVNDRGAHWSIVLLQDTDANVLLDNINLAGWTKLPNLLNEFEPADNGTSV